MKQLVSYTVLQWKRSLRAFLTVIAIFAVTTLSVIGVFWGISTLLKSGTFSIIKVGLVFPEEEMLTEYVTDFISSMDSVKSVCSFEKMDEKTAMEQYNNGTLKAVIVLPSGFYHDVQVGINPPAVIYWPEDPGIAGNVFKELLLSGVSYLQTAESAVYAALSTANIHGSKVEVSGIGNSIALTFVNFIFERDRMFSETFVSALGRMSFSSYYFRVGLILCLMFLGLFFNKMYTAAGKAVDDKLRINGVNYVVAAIGKIVVMWPVIFVWGMLIYLSGVFVSERFELEMVKFNPMIFGMMALIALTMAVYFQLIFGLTRDSRKGMLVLTLVNVLGSVCSGLIIPSAYLADWTVTLGNFLPMRWWLVLLSNGISGKWGGIF